MTVISLQPVTSPVRQAEQGPHTGGKTEAQVSSATHPSCQSPSRYRTRGSKNSRAEKFLSGPSPESAGGALPTPSRASVAEPVVEPRAPGSQASAPQTTRLSWKKQNLWVNTFWKQRTVSPILSDQHNPFAFQGSDKFCSEENSFTL